eukprot:8570486-Karenia_brevis.AAC.1
MPGNQRGSQHVQEWVCCPQMVALSKPPDERDVKKMWCELAEEEALLPEEAKQQQMLLEAASWGK